MLVRGVMTSRTTVSPNPTTFRISSRSSSSRMPSASPSSSSAVTASSEGPSSSVSLFFSWFSIRRSAYFTNGATIGARRRWTGE